jgi:hypothetical protein
MLTGTDDAGADAGALAAEEAAVDGEALLDVEDDEPEEQAARPTRAVAARAMDAVILIDEVMDEG